MSTSIADVLRAHGFATPATQSQRDCVALQTQAGSHATHATHATHAKHTPELVAAKPAPEATAMRARLLELAAAAFMDAVPVRALSGSFLRECYGLSDDALRALLSMLRDNTDRRAGRVPAGDTAAILCPYCGPVYVHPSVAAVLPVVDGWPRSIGCPWCFIRKDGLYVPHPTCLER